MRLGAIIAGQPDSILSKITDFAIPLGKAFQIRDDILNIVGEGSVYGKEIGGDIFEGKRTGLLIHLIKNTTGEERKKVLEIMNKPREKKTTKEVEFIVDLMKKRGSVKYSEKMAEQLADEAKAKFNKYFAKVSNKDEFDAAIDFFALKRKV
jgi:geranylgeranyl diphosphate synthase type II